MSDHHVGSPVRLLVHRCSRGYPIYWLDICICSNLKLSLWGLLDCLTEVLVGDGLGGLEGEVDNGYVDCRNSEWHSGQFALTVGLYLIFNYTFKAGSTRPTALAAPVDEGMILTDAALPALQSFPPWAGPSTTNWVAVDAWTVVMSPSAMPKFSWSTFARGAKQLVVHEALDTMFMLAL
jgi:hypothetical protein